MKTAVVYYAHDVTPVRIREMRRLATEAPADYDLWVVGCCPERTTLDRLADGRVRTAAYMKDDLRELPYPTRLERTRWSNMRGAADLALLRFFRDHPLYDRYWFIEYDVQYTGLWSNFFETMEKSDADLLCAHVGRRRLDIPWAHWDSLVTCDEAEPEQMVQGFMVICRASQALLTEIDSAFCRGWSGHYEAVWPTLANIRGKKIEEIGGNTRFTPEERRGRYYGFASIPGIGRIGNLTAWPFYSDKSGFIHRTKDILWHPVKD
jgi:hypothetical protein